MTVPCPKCASPLESSWKFCPSCGSGVIHVAEIHAHEHEKAPARYAYAGLFFGLVSAPVFIIYGIMICLLGPWMVVGLPMIALGIISPVLGPYLAINAIRGKCPYCNATISSVGPLDAFYCYKCSQKIVVRNREMFKAEIDHPAGVQPAA